MDDDYFDFLGNFVVDDNTNVNINNCHNAMIVSYLSCFEKPFDQLDKIRGKNFVHDIVICKQSLDSENQFTVAETREGTIYVGFKNYLERERIFLQGSKTTIFGEIQKDYYSRAERISTKFLEEPIFQKKEIVITGYGTGGAVAQAFLLSMLCKHCNTDLISCISFGSPLLVDFNFAKNIKEHGWNNKFFSVVDKVI